MNPSSLPFWPRHVVHEVAPPDASVLEQAPHAWLWLYGWHSDTLWDDVFAITRRFDAEWVWRGTDWEYAGPGYRAGPLLVPWRDALLKPLLDTWAPQEAGMVVLGGSAAELIPHLQRLRTISTANGDRVHMDLGNTRILEELCEALPAHRRAELLGPIHALIWPEVDTDATQWLRVDNPSPAPTMLRDNGDFTLTSAEEAFQNETSRAWFMRDVARRLTCTYPSEIAELGDEAYAQQLNVFAREAARLDITHEQDVRHYLHLRLVYPQDPFANDSALRAVLMNRQLSARQRLDDVEHRLQTHASRPA